MGFAELLQIDAPNSLSAKDLSHLKAIFSEAKRMGILIDDLLAFSHVGRTEFKKIDVDLNELLRETLTDLQLETKGRAIVWEIQPLPTVRGDRALLRMVFINLVSNAIKFTGARSDAKIGIGCLPNGSDEIVVFVRDNGAGFDPKYTKKLFGVFQRLHSQSEFAGTGIGLANVRRIIHRHGGRVWGEGSPGKGATFYFSIPKKNGAINGH
jgi:light-regulated signal transduction histidine kinase (bacteriophytochrome)